MFRFSKPGVGLSTAKIACELPPDRLLNWEETLVITWLVTPTSHVAPIAVGLVPVVCQLQKHNNAPSVKPDGTVIPVKLKLVVEPVVLWVPMVLVLTLNLGPRRYNHEQPPPYRRTHSQSSAGSSRCSRSNPR